MLLKYLRISNDFHEVRIYCHFIDQDLSEVGGER